MRFMEVNNMANKIYVLTGERGYGEDFESKILHVCDSESEAKKSTEGNYEFTIQVWCQGGIIKKLKSFGGGTWQVKYDMIVELEQDIARQKYQLKIDESRLKTLKEQIEG